jgi:uncharacterized protein involved in outer membrane biogenesis
MKKALIAVLVLIVLIVGGIVWYVLGNLDSIVKAAIEKYGSQVTQTAVRVNRVHIVLKEGSGGIYGLTVANPRGYDTRTAVSLGETSIKLDLKSLSKDLIVIDQVTVRDPRVNYEMNADRKGSLNQLYDNIKKSMPAGGGEGAAAGPKLIIRKLTFEGGEINAKLIPVDKKKIYTVKLPPLYMSNLGAPKGATGGEIAKQILARVTKQAQDEVKRQIVDKQLKGAIEEQKKKLQGQAQEQVESQKKKLEEQMKDLLKH